MNTNVDTSLEYFLSIVEDIEEPCEHGQHDERRDLHSGPGAWYITSLTCPNCGRKSSTRLVCEKFAQYIFTGGKIKCGDCGIYKGNGVSAYKGVRRKG